MFEATSPDEASKFITRNNLPTSSLYRSSNVAAMVEDARRPDPAVHQVAGSEAIAIADGDSAVPLGEARFHVLDDEGNPIRGYMTAFNAAAFRSGFGSGSIVDAESGWEIHVPTESEQPKGVAIAIHVVRTADKDVLTVTESKQTAEVYRKAYDAMHSLAQKRARVDSIQVLVPAM